MGHLWLFLVSSFPAYQAKAQVVINPPDSETITFPNPLSCDDFQCVATKIMDALFDISIPIVAIMVLVGGFQILTAGGDAEKFGTGKKTILYAAIGFVAIFMARGVVGIIQSIFN